MPSESGATLPQTCCPTVWLRPGEALYAGPGLNLSAHSGSVWCLAVGVDGPLTVTLDDGARAVSRSVLIPPRLSHHLASDGCIVSFYFEHGSRCARDSFTDRVGPVAVDHTDETGLVVPPTDDASAQRWRELAVPVGGASVDPRITAALNLIREDPAAAVSTPELAAHAALSESRFLHLFRQEVGTSVRRYRMWVRLVHAGSAIARGDNLTAAAASAGFASPSHLSDRFKSTFGLTATQLLGTGVTVRTYAV